MKIIIYTIFALTSVGCYQNNLKQISEEELIKRIVSQKMPAPEKLSFYNSYGNEISFDSVKSLESTNLYFEDFYVNSNNEIVRLVIRPKTDKDDILISKINKELDLGPRLNKVKIDCADKANILQKLHDRDQEMRMGDAKINPQIDHENLEIVVSFIEQCGIPTLKEVNEEQMMGLWAVLQHAHPRYQSKYIPLLEKSAEKGDLKWSAIALMKDRSLMSEGKPQIYGSQISNGELYNLFEPEYVDQRRAELGMEPIGIYLQNFGIKFNIEQKKKQ
ncbi:MAG TPA: hypothetical protein PKD18_03640 [Saprospiraceae bacterium]|nr:hypothetical protein [Saprospiraceae bacterium]